MVAPSHVQLSIQSQCQLLSISRSGWYYEPKGGIPAEPQADGVD